MAFRILDAAFVIEHGNEFARRVEKIGEFLCGPPGILAPAAVIVVAASHPVQCAGIQDVAPLIEYRSVVAAVAGYLAMAGGLARPHTPPVRAIPAPLRDRRFLCLVPRVRQCDGW